MKKHFLTVLLVSVFGCSNHSSLSVSEDEMVGVYKNQEPIWSEKKQYKTRFYVGGSTLALSKDKTYLFKTCGMFMSGTWEKKEDSLYLFLKHYKFLSDSLNRIKQDPPPRSFFVYKVNPNSLIAHFDQLEQPEKTTINKLVKE